MGVRRIDHAVSSEDAGHATQLRGRILLSILGHGSGEWNLQLPKLPLRDHRVPARMPTPWGGDEWRIPASWLNSSTGRLSHTAPQTPLDDKSQQGIGSYAQ